MVGMTTSRILSSDQDVRVCIEACEAIRMIAYDDGIPALRAAIHDPRPNVRIAALHALSPVWSGYESNWIKGVDQRFPAALIDAVGQDLVKAQADPDEFVREMAWEVYLGCREDRSDAVARRTLSRPPGFPDVPTISQYIISLARRWTDWSRRQQQLPSHPPFDQGTVLRLVALIDPGIEIPQVPASGAGAVPASLTP
jgi:hypothetical protein